jgi:hypothetical protein
MARHARPRPASRRGGAIPAVDEFMLGITMRNLIKLIKLIVLATLAFLLAAGTVLVMKIRPALCVQACQPLTPRCGGWPGNRGSASRT